MMFVGERADQRDERGADDHRDRQLDDVAAQDEVLEALDHVRLPRVSPRAWTAPGRRDRPGQ